MKRIIAICLILILACSAVNVCAASEDETQRADALHELGLFNGTGTNADGSPIYDLDKVPTRAEAITMLVRLLGKESEAKANAWDTPFTDVAEWAKPYVGYAYNNGLTSGTSAATFSGSNPVNETQYLTFILRALGYDDKAGDFQWDKAKDLSDTIGITGPGTSASVFNRGGIVSISYNALSAKLKDGSKTLIKSLYESKAVKTQEVPQTLNDALASIDTSKILTGYDEVNAFLLYLKPDQTWNNKETGLYHFIYNDHSVAEKICNYIESHDLLYGPFDNKIDDAIKVDYVRVEVVKTENNEGTELILYDIEDFDGKGGMISKNYRTKMPDDTPHILKGSDIPLGNQTINDALFDLTPFYVIKPVSGKELYHFVWLDLDMYETIVQYFDNSGFKYVNDATKEHTNQLDVEGTFVRVELNKLPAGDHYYVQKFDNGKWTAREFVLK